MSIAKAIVVVVVVVVCLLVVVGGKLIGIFLVISNTFK